MGMQVDQARHEGGQPEVGDLLFGIAQLQHVHLADVADDPVAHEHRPVLKRLGCDGEDILCAQ